MGKIVVINASPRLSMNTASLLKSVEKGIKEEGAEALRFDLYRLENLHGCLSCFACKRKPNEGKCVYRDGLYPVLEAIRGADGLVIGTPNYLGDASAMFRLLYERLIFQTLTYQRKTPRYPYKRVPVLFIMTSNCPAEYYDMTGYSKMVEGYKNALTDAVGNTEVMVVGDTKQVNDYGLYDWTMFDKENKKKRHEEVFPKELEQAYSLGKRLVKSPW